MESIFSNSSGNTVPVSDEDDYTYTIRMLIADAVDYEQSELSPRREMNQKYYYGDEPALVSDDPDMSYTEDDEVLQQSSIVSTDVRDTVMAIMPSLMRVFTSTEHTINFFPSIEEHTEFALQATDYISYKFWEDNDGFLKLHSVLKDCLTVKIGVFTWRTDISYEVAQKEFQNISEQQLSALIDEATEAEMEPEIVDMDQPNEFGVISSVLIKYVKSAPKLVVDAVPPEEFRVSRRAKTVETADLIGREYPVRASELIAKGFDYDTVMEHVGVHNYYSQERDLRVSGIDTTNPTDDTVLYGEYYIRADEDGDGINELHRICTIGGNYDIIDDQIVTHAKMAVFCADPRPHAIVGDCPADLVIEIQDIKTNVLRGSLDSLAETLNPRTAINETLTNVADALSTERGALIRTRGNPHEAIATLSTEFVGAAGFQMLSQIDVVRQMRTGISEASKGMDPKALQSTNVVGIDAIITGAQERIELIARILAETGLKPLFKGLLREVCENTNKPETVQLRGKWTEVNPSLFDPNMRCSVNPSLGKGSDTTRLQALTEVKNVQMMIIEKFGLANPVVTVQEFRNTMVDILAIANIKNVSRYFKEIPDEVAKAIAEAPKEPEPGMLIAQAEMEKVKQTTIKETVKADQEDRRLTTQEAKIQADDDFRRDELNVNSFLTLLSDLKDIAATDANFPKLRGMNEPE